MLPVLKLVIQIYIIQKCQSYLRNLRLHLTMAALRMESIIPFFKRNSLGYNHVQLPVNVFLDSGNIKI